MCSCSMRFLLSGGIVYCLCKLHKVNNPVLFVIRILQQANKSLHIDRELGDEIVVLMCVPWLSEILLL